jgi:hypothetical protein
MTTGVMGTDRHSGAPGPLSLEMEDARGGFEMSNVNLRLQWVAALGLLASFWATDAPCQTLQITAPADGAVVSSGQTITVVVNADSSSFQAVGIFAQSPLASTPMATSSPYQFEIEIPADLPSGSYSLTALGVPQQPGSPVTSTIDIDVERTDVPTSISSDSASASLPYVGTTDNLTITGAFSDGSYVILTRSSLLQFASDTPSVATVDARGIITAAGSGTANVTVTYGTGPTSQVSVSVPVTVPAPLTVSPSPVSLYTSQSQPFYAKINVDPSLDQSVTWSISPQLGNIDQTGLYTAPASVASWQGVTVTATSVADPTKSASAQVWIFPPVSIGVNPSSVTMSAAQAQTFTPAVANGGTSVTWATNPSGVGTIQLSQGTNPNNPYLPIGVATYFAPAPISVAQTVTITATSVSDNSKTASAQVTLVPSVAVSVSPSTVSLNGSQSQQFAATVNYSPGGAVTWSLSPSVGAISATGLYAAPATVTYQQTVSVIATGPDIGAGTYSGTAAVTLMPQISASITVPAAVTAVAASNSEID